MIVHVFDVQAPPPHWSGYDRPVRPPKSIWVDLPAWFGPAGDEHCAEGWQVGERIAGELRAWGRDSSGRWIALVHYRLTQGCGPGMWLTHWLPAALVSPRTD